MLHDLPLWCCGIIAYLHITLRVAQRTALFVFAVIAEFEVFVAEEEDKEEESISEEERIGLIPSVDLADSVGLYRISSLCRIIPSVVLVFFIIVNVCLAR